MAKCRGCGADMRWAVNENGKGVPLDTDPVPDGNIVLTGERQPGGRPFVRYLKKGQPPPPPGALRFVSHFSTCPQAGTFRRG